jgi:acetyl-CoA synthetase
MSTAEIEHTAIGHDKISDSASIAIPDEITGEAVILFVVPEDKNVENLGQDVSEYISQKIGKIARPKAVYVLSDLPKTRTGKIMRRVLKSKLLGLELGDLSSLENPEVLNEIQKLS